MTARDPRQRSLGLRPASSYWPESAMCMLAGSRAPIHSLRRRTTLSSVHPIACSSWRSPSFVSARAGLQSRRAASPRRRHSLPRCLLQPFDAEPQPGRHLWLDLDPSLEALPVVALTVPSGAWLAWPSAPGSSSRRGDPCIAPAVSDESAPPLPHPPLRAQRLHRHRPRASRSLWLRRALLRPPLRCSMRPGYPEHRASSRARCSRGLPLQRARGRRPGSNARPRYFTNRSRSRTHARALCRPYASCLPPRRAGRLQHQRSAHRSRRV